MSPNPYKKIWDEHPSHYGDELSQYGSAFMPTYHELALRSVGTTKFLLWKARKLNSYGDYILAHQTFQEALSHQRIAKGLMDQHRKVLSNSR